MNVSVVEARSLTLAERRALGELILSGFPETLAEDPDVAERWREHAWRTVPATWHVVAGSAAAPAGQLSIFRLSPHADTTVYGLGDVVVAAPHRGRGIARALVARALATCRAHDAQLIAMLTEPLAGVARELGFVADPGAEVVCDGDGAPLDGAWVWRAPDAPAGPTVLDPADF